MLQLHLGTKVLTVKADAKVGDYVHVVWGMWRGYTGEVVGTRGNELFIMFPPTGWGESEAWIPKEDTRLMRFGRSHVEFRALVVKCVLAAIEAGVLEEFFGPRPIDVSLIRKALRGIRTLMLHLRRGRVTVLYRGGRRDVELSPAVAREILRAFKEKGYGFLVSLLPKVGRSSAELRVIG